MKDIDIIKNIESLLQLQLKPIQKDSYETNTYTLQNDRIIALRISNNQNVKENLKQLTKFNN